MTECTSTDEELRILVVGLHIVELCLCDAKVTWNSGRLLYVAEDGLELLDLGESRGEYFSYFSLKRAVCSVDLKYYLLFCSARTIY